MSSGLSRLSSEVVAGVIVASVSLTVAISVGTLIAGVAGPEFAPRGIGISLTSTLVAMLSVTLLGSVRGAVSVGQDGPVAVIAGAGAGVVAQIGSGGEVAFATIIALTGLTTVGTGIAFMAVGWLRLGRLVRFLPYPVMGGFLAATGWLLLLGGMSVMSGRNVDLLHLPGTVDSSWLSTVVPGIAFAALLLMASRSLKQPAALPLLVAFGFTAFYAVMLLTGNDADTWREQGLIIQAAGEGSLLFGFRLSDLTLVDWSALATQLPAAATVPVVALVAMLLNVTALEYEVKERVGLDRELRASGLGNLISGGLGGLVGYHAVSLSALNRRVGSGSRLAVLVAAAVVLLALVFGGSLVAYLPRPVVGGVVAYLGLEFLYDWLWAQRRSLGRVEYGIVVVILVVVVFSAFLQGVAVGLGLTVLLFVVTYARIDPVRYAVTGAELRSRVRRSEQEESVLAAASSSVLVLQLQGFLFFGTTARVVDRAETAWRERGVKYLVLDLARVTGMDASGVTALKNLAQRAGDQGGVVALAGLSPEIAGRLGRGGVGAELDGPVRIFGTVDEALESFEAGLLTAHQDSGADVTSAGLDEALQGTGLQAADLEAYLQRIELRSGDVLIRQGEDADGLYLIASGKVTAERLRDGMAPERFETMGAGAVVGEVGLVSGQRRGATVRANSDAVVYCLTRASLARLQLEDARTAMALYSWLTRLMSARITHLVTTVDALRR